MAPSGGWWVVVKKKLPLAEGGSPSAIVVFAGWGYRKSHPDVVGFHPFTMRARHHKQRTKTPQPPGTVTGVVPPPLEELSLRWRRLVAGG
jgi:hypothetical protein